MKKSFKKLMPITMAGIMIFGSLAPIFATVKDTQTVTSNSTQQTEVTYNQESSFEVIVPKLVDLGSDKFTNYEVTVSGDISSDEVVKVVPEESFFMKDKSGTTNLKADVEAAVTQDKTEWIFNEFATKANGNISAPNLTAGNWEGSFFFNIKLDKASAEEAVTLEAGLYDVNGALLCTWEDSKINVSTDYTYSTYKTNSSSGYYVITNNYPTATTVVMPESVTSIGNYAFHGCSSLTSITISEGVTSIGNSAFSGCSSLTSITIPESVVIIGEDAFSGCGFSAITIPNSVTSIGEWAFYGCSSLTSITIPEGVTSIGDCVFGECSSLTSITIPESVTSIGWNAFSNCDSLTSITIPESVISIGDSAFYSCNNLTSITISEGVTSIDTSAFSNCDSLTSITIPESVTSIGNSVFEHCSSLTSITWNGKTYTSKATFNIEIKSSNIFTGNLFAGDVWS